jgi:hypothetical protein
MQKKLIFLQVIFCILVWSSSRSQPAVGVKIGATFSRPQTNNTSMSASSPSYLVPYNNIKGGGGILLGLFVPIELSQKIYLRPSAEIAFRTVKAQASTMYGTYKTTHPVNYLDIPVPIAYVIQRKGAKLFLGAGPSLSLLLNPSYQFLQFTKKTDFGINGLVALESKIGFSINLNYIHGFGTLTMEQELKNRFLNLSIGYLF